MNYYNENNPEAAEWLKYLMIDGHISEGHIDRRSITEVKAEEIQDYTQCHFFAGIGGWSLALKMANVSPDYPIDTASCPCQPFSNAGKQLGYDDPRHLWPILRELTKKRRPAILIGEQVASEDGRGWLAGVQFDLENMGYAFGAADLCAAGIGAPHIRQRLYWMAHTNDTGPQRRGCAELRECSNKRTIGENGGSGWMGYPESNSKRGIGEPEEGNGWKGAARGSSPWDAFEFLPFKDGKLRRIKPGSFPLAHGVPGRVGLLRGYGNAIVPPLAATFVECALESIAEI